MKNAIVLYMPALHDGCIRFIARDGRKVNAVFLISETLVQATDPELALTFEKYLNAVPAVQMQKSLSALNLSDAVFILDTENLKGFDTVIIPDDEDVEKMLLRAYPDITPTKEDAFIRWGRKTVLSKRALVPGAVVSSEEFDREILLKGFEVAQKSSDWWRKVGAIIFPIDADPIHAFNHHLPHWQAPYINGDPRSCFKPGEETELSTAIHAERSAIAYAARKGIALEGAVIYVTTFPCPTCAGVIAEAGIKKVYYCEGWSSLNAAEIFGAAGIEMVFVNVPE